MRLKPRRLLSYVLLATYAGISILGDGLHELMHEAGHHHHNGLCIVAHAHHSGHQDDDADSYIGPGGPVVIANDGDIESHVCEICQFLLQSIGQPVVVAAPIDWQPLVVARTLLPQPIYSPACVGLQAPRGPPLAA